MLPKKLIIVDSRVSDWQSLITGVDTTHTDVLVLDSTTDGLTQITDQIASYNNLEAIFCFIVLIVEEKTLVGTEKVGMIRVMADFSKAAYNLVHGSIIENTVINDASTNNSGNANLNKQGWLGLNLNPNLKTSPINRDNQLQHFLYQ